MSSPATILVTATRSGAAATVVINRGPAGSSTLAGLSDIATFDLPVENTPLADALALKADSASLATVATSGSYDDLSDAPTQAFVIPEFAAPTSLDANATATTAAIQAAIDTRRAVFIPAGTYKLNATLSLSTQGQVIRGESCTRTILQWISDVDGMEITTSDESNTTNFPGSSVDGSSWGRVSDLLLYGPSGSTKKAFKNTTDASPTLWIGEGWRLDFMTVSRWETGLYSTKAARYNCRSLTFKDCSNRCVFLSGDDGVNNSATNNCHIFNGVNCSNSGIGLELESVNSGVFTLQDFAQVGIGVKASACHCEFFSGELESYTTRFFELDGGNITISGARFLGSTTIAPISAEGECSLYINNSRQAQAGNAAPLVLCLDGSPRVFGFPCANVVSGDPGDLETAKVELSNGDVVYLSPFPWIGGSAFVGSEADERGIMHWRNAIGANHHNMDDLQATIEVGGEYVHAGAFKRNNFVVDHTTTVAYTPQGFEDIILMSATGARTVNLRATNSAYYRASEQVRKFKIVDASGNAGTNAITINASGADTINGQSSYVINSDYGEVTLGFRNDGKIFVLDEVKDNSATATALETGREINGVVFDGTQNITVTADAGTLTGLTLAATVTGSSLTSVGTIGTGVWQGTAIADAYIASAATWNAQGALAESAVQEGDSPSFVDVTASGTVTAASGTYKTGDDINFFTVRNGNSESFPVAITTWHYGSTFKGQISAISQGLKIRGNSQIIFTAELVEVARMNATGLAVVGNIEASGTVKTGSYTVATLPTPSTGMRAQVTDSNRPAHTHFGSAVIAAGGGTAYTVPVFYDGTDWIIA